MGHSLNSIFDRMGKIIHRIDAPFVPGVMVSHMSHPVNNRVSHIDIRRSHIDLCSEHMAAIRKLPVFHSFKQVQIFLYASVTVRAFLSRLCESSPVFPNLFRAEITDKSFPFLNQLDRGLIHLVKIVGSKIQPVLPVCSQPFYICLDGIYKLCFFLGGIGVIKAKIKLSVILLCQSII